MAPDEKLCPFCAEVIKAAAIKCRWCGSELAGTELPGTELPGTELAGTELPEPDAIEPDAASAPELLAESVTPADPVEAPAVAVAMTPAGRRGPLLAIALLVALLLAAAGLWVVVRQASQDTVAPNGQLTSEGARRAIMQQGAALTTKAMSYRAAQSAADIKAAESVMTPRMKAKYEKSLPPQDQRGTQAQLGIEVKASVASMSGANGTCQPADCAVALLSATRGSADLLVFVDQDATAKGGKNTVVSPTWERVRLVKRNGIWLIDDMSAS